MRINFDGKELIISVDQLENINCLRTEYLRRFLVPLRFQYINTTEYNPKCLDFIEVISLGKRRIKPDE